MYIGKRIILLKFKLKIYQEMISTILEGNSSDNIDNFCCF
jgi:hypothetical protein